MAEVEKFKDAEWKRRRGQTRATWTKQSHPGCNQRASKLGGRHMQNVDEDSLSSSLLKRLITPQMSTSTDIKAE